ALSALAHSPAGTLIARAGDVTLEEGRPLVLVARETPLHLGHLRAMLALAQMGAIILPPLPAFYPRPRTVDDVVNHTVGRVLDRFGIPHDLVGEWTGSSRSRRRPDPGPEAPCPRGSPTPPGPWPSRSGEPSTGIRSSAASATAASTSSGSPTGSARTTASWSSTAASSAWPRPGRRTSTPSVASPTSCRRRRGPGRTSTSPTPARSAARK